MNQRLVESVVQIVLSMSEAERHLLGQKLQNLDLRRLDEPTGTEKSLRVAELAQDIQAFEELYNEEPYSNTPLSSLPPEQWAITTEASDNMPFSTAQPQPRTPQPHHPLRHDGSRGWADEVDNSIDHKIHYTTVAPTTQIDASVEVSEEARSFFQLTQGLESDVALAELAMNNAGMDYALHAVLSQSDRF